MCFYLQLIVTFLFFLHNDWSLIGVKGWDWRQRVTLEAVSDNTVGGGDEDKRIEEQDSKKNLKILKLSYDR